MNISNASRCVVSLIGLMGIAGLLAACGSEGAPSVSASGSGSGSGSASASGTITEFGSVFVNGKKFETENVEVRHDGVIERCTINAVTTCGLKKGMMVTVNGSFNGTQRSASTVHQKDAVEGLVQSVAADGLSLVVMGQTVLLDNTTIIDNNIPGQDVRNLVAGTDAVEVNGHIRPNGVIQATFIEKKPMGTVTPEVRGFVSNHASGSATFRIGTLTVHYSGADISDMPTPNGNNWDGRFVEVKGMNFDSETTTLVATKVEPENQGIAGNIDEFEVEGYVTQVLGAGDFLIGNTHVQTTSNTEFRGGTIDEIVVGAKLSAEGRWENNVLTAKHVKFHESVRLEGDIAAIGTDSITIRGLSGITVTANRQTEFRASGGRTIDTLSDLAVNDHVRVRGRVTGSNTVIATRIQLRSPDNDVVLQGPVQLINGQTLVILNTSIDTSGLQDNHFEGLNGQVIGRAAFFNTVQVGTLVKVQGRLVGETVQWREVELED